MALIICYNHGNVKFSVLDALDIIITAFLLFQIYRLLKRYCSNKNTAWNGSYLLIVPIGTTIRNETSE